MTEMVQLIATIPIYELFIIVIICTLFKMILYAVSHNIIFAVLIMLFSF